MIPDPAYPEGRSTDAPDPLDHRDDARSCVIGDPFDAGAAGGPARVVEVDRVVDLLHVTHAADTISRYARAMAAGDRFPPIAVFPVGKRMIIADGHKRFSACKILGVSRITVELWSVSRLVADLWGQGKAHAGEAATALAQLFRGRDGRREARAFARRNLAHWRRTAVSLLRLIRKR